MSNPKRASDLADNILTFGRHSGLLDVRDCSALWLFDIMRSTLPENSKRESAIEGIHAAKWMINQIDPCANLTTIKSTVDYLREWTFKSEAAKRVIIGRKKEIGTIN